MYEYIVVGVLLLAFEVAYLIAAKRLSIVDLPHHQSSHTGAIIRGGGIVFYFAYFLWFISGGLLYPMVFVGLTILSIVSFIDDIHSISPKIRLALQFIAIIVMLYETEVFALKIETLLLLSFACVITVNIFNFMDGVNGMTGGYSTVVLCALLYINVCCLEFIDNNLLVILLIADIVFGIFNFRNKAKCFAGDVGSLSIGFIIIFLLLKLMFTAQHMHWIAFVGVYIIDGGMTILHRIMLSENVMTPHKKHVYQIMANELGMSHIKVSLIYMTLQLICCAWFVLVPGNVTLLVQLSLLVSLYLWFIYNYYPLHANNINKK